MIAFRAGGNAYPERVSPAVIWTYLRAVEQVEKADREQLARWYRFLPSGDTPERQKIQHRLAERFQKMGGMTPELSRKIGFGGE